MRFLRTSSSRDGPISRGAQSGVPIDDEVTFVFTVGQAKVVRWQMFSTEREALEAVGVAE
jgi:hypothetical protein